MLPNSLPKRFARTTKSHSDQAIIIASNEPFIYGWVPNPNKPGKTRSYLLPHHLSLTHPYICLAGLRDAKSILNGANPGSWSRQGSISWLLISSQRRPPTHPSATLEQTAPGRTDLGDGFEVPVPRVSTKKRWLWTAGRR